MTIAVQNYISFIVLRLFLPLMPLSISYIYDGNISAKVMTLTASMYAVTQCLSTKHILNFSISIFIGLVLAASYGAIDPKLSAFPLTTCTQVYAIITIMIMHGFERYSRHITDREPFFNFPTQEKNQ